MTAVIDARGSTTQSLPSLPGSDMVRVEPGTFLMGSDRHYPEEQPVSRVTVDGFWIDRFAVTNADFQRFVNATGYATFAERPPIAEDYPGALPDLLKPGSLVFINPERPVDMRDIGNWWSYMIGADWRHPHGPDSSIHGLEGHPVVHVAFEDAKAYAAWVGKQLPTETEWEFAARGGLDGATYTWGDEFAPSGRLMANTWQGTFPWQDLAQDGYAGTAPVGSFPANGYGLYDTAGNVWEWTGDWYRARAERSSGSCCGASARQELGAPDALIPPKVIKGGSYLCAPNYCQRYRPAARYPQPIDTSTCHLGFRCVVRSDDVE